MVQKNLFRYHIKHEAEREIDKDVMVYSHWLHPEPGQGSGPGLCRTFNIAQGLGRMGRMVLIRTFHTAPEQGHGKTLVFITRNIFRTGKMGTRPNLKVLKMFPVFILVPVQVQCERFLLKLYNPFFLVPVPAPDQASVNTPLRVSVFISKMDFIVINMNL